MNQSQWESPLVPTEVADAPDIENVPAAQSAHALMEAVVEIHGGVREILAALSPDTVVERMRAMVPTAMALMNEAVESPGSCQCRTGTDDTCAEHSATPAPLDPSKVKAGDTVTLDHPDGTHLPNRTVGSVYAITIGRRQEYLNDLYAEGYTLTDHQPAPEPEPAYDVGTVGTATVRGVEGVRVMRSHRTGSVASEFWLSDGEVGGYLQHQDDYVTDVRPLVLIDEQRARDLVEDHFNDLRSRALLGALLDGAR